MFSVHPLTLVILPAVLIVYLLWVEEKRLKARYGPDLKKPTSYMIGGTTQPAYRSEAERAVDEYKQMLEKKRQSKESKN
jgi:hypothetical protein